MKKIIPVVFFFITICAWSNAPSPVKSANTDQLQTAENKNVVKTNVDQRGTEQKPIFVKAIESEKDANTKLQEQKDAEAKASDERSLVVWTIVLGISTIVLAVIAGFQLYMFWRQLKLMASTIDDSKKIASATVAQANAVIHAERAYIKISPSPPGIMFPPSDGITEHLTCNHEIRNCGQTPATITDVVTIFKMLGKHEKLPEIPKYERDDEDVRPFPGSFLGRNDFFYNGHGAGAAKGTLVDDIRASRVSLVVYGYVDYIDVFNNHHRSGFGRILLPRSDDRALYDSDEQFSKRSNLIYMNQSGYNYDCLRNSTDDAI